MNGTGTLLVLPDADGVLLQGVGTLEVQNTSIVEFSGTGELEASSWRAGVIDTNLPPLGGVLASKAFGMLNASLPELTVFMEGGGYLPEATQTVYGNLPPLVFSGRLVRTRSGSIDVDLPRLGFKAGDENGVAEIVVNLPPLLGGILSDLTPGVANFFTQLFVTGSANMVSDYVVFLSMAGQITDTISGSREVIETLLEAITAAGTFSVYGSFVIDTSVEISAYHIMQAGLSDRPMLDTSSRVWVVNMDNGASSQYDDYGFNSFFERDGEYFGVADDGIYKLDGDDDEGAEIEALIQTGKTDFGTAYKKRIPNIYLGISSDGKVLLKINADEVEYVYEARSSSTDLKNQRVDTGKGLAGTYYTFTLLNQNGEDIDLETISFEPLILSRKI